MKRIRYAFPVESMSGKLAAEQDLRYGQDNQKAFDAASANAQYANNYKPAVVAAHVRRTLLNYFTIKTKTAFKGTADALRQCALMGATSAIYAIAIKDLSILTNLQLQFKAAQEAGYEGTWHKWLTDFIRADLAANAAQIKVVGPSATITIGNNPFSDASTAINIAKKLLVKFWRQLASGGIQFTVAGAKGISLDAMTFDDIITIERLNVLCLNSAEVGSYEYVKLGDMWLKNSENEYVSTSDEPLDGDTFVLTAIAPQA